MKVLVTYATRHGATKGIAERIAETLSGRGFDLTVDAASAVAGVDAYDAFVIGSAAYAGHWMKDATALVREHVDVLSTRPVWLFSSGPVGNDKVDKNGRDVLETAAPREFAELDSKVHPRGEHVFFGAYDPDVEPVDLPERMMKGIMRVVPAMRDLLPKGDFRDWPAIDEWANTIADQLEAVEAVTTPV